jgi:protein gp37
MSDLCHKEVPDSFIQKVFEIMHRAPQHRYQILTKRSERLLELDRLVSWHSNIWMGVTVENADYIERIEHLRSCSAEIKFISFEPLIGPIYDVDLSGIDWVIVGGESGPGARPMEREWVIELREKCLVSDTPFFFKQWGGVNKKKNGRLLEGKTWDELPELIA